jgi:mercuric reductase
VPTRYDLAVIGSGGAGFAAAIAARRKGRTVIMIDHGTVGGTCVNVGCVPSKALLAAAEARHGALDHRFPGISTRADGVDAAALSDGIQDLVAGMRADKYVDLAAKYGWRILTGHASFRDGPALEVELVDDGETRVDAEHYLIATGSTPWAPPIDGLAEIDYLTSTTAIALDAIPASLLVLGGGYIGLELSQLFARLGSHVTVVTRSQLASGGEPEISDRIKQVFTDEAITVYTNTTMRSIRAANGGVSAALIGSNGQPCQVRAERLLVATGRRPVTENLDLEHVGVKTTDIGHVVVDEHLRTSHPRIWAAGDVIGHPQFVYVAAAQGALVADNVFGGDSRSLDYRHLPHVTFTSPAVAGAGLTEAQAVEQGYATESRVLSLEHVPRALVNRDTRGLIKLVADRDTGQLLGAHVLADSAGEVIATAVFALVNRMTVQQIADVWCPYLTMAEGLKITARTFTHDVTTLSCCAS